MPNLAGDIHRHKTLELIISDPTMNPPDIANALCQIIMPSSDAEAMFGCFSEEDWNKLMALASQHHLTTIVFDQLKGRKLVSALPKNVQESLHTAYLTSAVRNTIVLHEVEHILAAFATVKLPTIGLKGIFLTENAYSNIALRSMGDIDFLVKHQDIIRAISCLKDLGYHPKTYFNLDDENTDLKHVPPLFKPDKPPVELHWSIAEADWPFQIQIDELWKRAIPAKIAGVNALALGIEDLLLHLCIHFTYQHRLRAGLRSLYDLVVVQEAFMGQIDWQALANRAKEWRVERIVALTFRLLEDLLKVKVPQILHEQIQTDSISPEILSSAKDQIFPQDEKPLIITPDLAQLSTAHGVQRKAHLIIKRIFLPKNIMARLYNVRPNSVRVFVYYPVRVIQLFKAYWHTTWQILSKPKAVASSVDREATSQQLHQWMTDW